MKERFIENGIEYVRNGDYYIPNFGVPECKHEIRKYGRLRRKHLKSNKPCQYSMVCPPSKNGHRKATKNGMNHNNSFVFVEVVAFIPRFT